jgi:glycosyltransferase involved in cell wall biosynthesis
MNSEPTCTVVIPTYNRETLLGYTLSSLTRQTLPRERFEVIVVDDGSSDATSTVVESFRDRLDLRYFFQEDKGLRVAKARNTGIVHANGDVCTFVDSGVLLHSGCLEAHLASHAAIDGPAAVCGYIYCFNMDNQDAARMRQVIDVDDVDSTVELLQREGWWLDIREGFYAKYTDQFHNLPAPWLMCWTANLSAETRQLRRIGMFDEALDEEWGGEDLDLGYRLHLDGAQVMVARQARSIHYPHEKHMDHNLAQVGRNYRYMAEKYRTPIIRLLAEVGLDERFFAMNDIIRERGLPRCADYLAQTEGQR